MRSWTCRARERGLRVRCVQNALSLCFGHGSRAVRDELVTHRPSHDSCMSGPMRIAERNLELDKLVSDAHAHRLAALRGAAICGRERERAEQSNATKPLHVYYFPRGQIPRRTPARSGMTSNSNIDRQAHSSVWSTKALAYFVLKHIGDRSLRCRELREVAPRRSRSDQ